LDNMINIIEYNLSFALLLLIPWNLAVFLLYGWDKKMAQKRSRRISEKSLIYMAFFMGGVGAYGGMRFFRHKTKHKKFIFLIPVFAILNGVAIMLIVLL